MITELHWSTDISKAPKGELVERHVTYQRNGETYTRLLEDFVPTPLMAVTSCGKVVRTYWIPPRKTANGGLLDGDRWSGFNHGSEPVAWALWPVAPELERAAA